ncbi:hypothetical protein, partial [Klebsiella pneumoniae]|uniref:hypothetical protein n=1 Tax=Klebsiella pneumoniae TaxID=573 RepID=UPI001C6F6DC7
MNVTKPALLNEVFNEKSIFLFFIFLISLIRARTSNTKAKNAIIISIASPLFCQKDGSNLLSCTLPLA